MSGHNAFDQMVTTTTQVQFTKHISSEEYDLWKKDYTWDALHGIRYGQSFCNRFGITDNLLYYRAWSTDETDAYVLKNYVR